MWLREPQNIGSEDIIMKYMQANAGHGHEDMLEIMRGGKSFVSDAYELTAAIEQDGNLLPVLVATADEMRAAQELFEAEGWSGCIIEDADEGYKFHDMDGALEVDEEGNYVK